MILLFWLNKLKIAGNILSKLCDKSAGTLSARKKAKQFQLKRINRERDVNMKKNRAICTYKAFRAY